MKMTTDTTQTAFRARAYTDADIPAMVDMLNACEAVDQLDESYSVEVITTALSEPTLDKPRDLRLWETEAGQLVGISWLRLRKSEEHGKLDSSLDFSVHPDFRDLHLEDTIMDWAFRRAEEAGLERNLRSHRPADQMDAAQVETVHEVAEIGGKACEIEAAGYPPGPAPRTSTSNFSISLIPP